MEGQVINEHKSIWYNKRLFLFISNALYKHLSFKKKTTSSITLLSEYLFRRLF